MQPFVAATEPIVMKPPEVRSARDHSLLALVLFVILAIIPALTMLGLTLLPPYTGWQAIDDLVEASSDILFGHVDPSASFDALVSPHLHLCASPLPHPLPPAPVDAPTTPPCTPSPVSLGIDFIDLSLIVGGISLFFIIWAIVAYFATIRPADAGKYEAARTRSLVSAIVFFLIALPFLSVTGLSLLVAFVTAPASIAFLAFLLISLSSLTSGILFLLAYGKLGEAVAKYGPVAVFGVAVPVPATVPALGAALNPSPSPQAAIAPQATTAPPQPPQPMAPQQPACPKCGRPLYYTPKYKRWYCLYCDTGT